jgi:hypothetical protein
MFTYTDFAMHFVSFKHILTSLTSFMGAPNSMRILLDRKCFVLDILFFFWISELEMTPKPSQFLTFTL